MNSLQNNYILYYHSLYDKNWDLDSYQVIGEFNTVDDFWKLHNRLPTLVCGSWYLMKNEIKPLWEDKENIKGGGWSFKLTKKFINYYWLEFVMAFIGQYITNDTNDFKDINGISLYPRNNTITIKVWNKNCANNTFDILNNNIPNITPDNSIYRANTQR